MNLHFRLDFTGILFLIIIPILLLALIFIYSIQTQTMSHKSEMLKHKAEMIAEIITNVAQFDTKYDENPFSFNDLRATVSQINSSFVSLSENELNLEYLIGIHKKDEIVFLAFSKEPPPAIKWSDHHLAVPMRKALMGEEGSIVQSDYLGNKVFAAYHPIKNTPLALVIKQPYANHSRPFIKAAIFIIVCTLLLSMFIFYVLHKNALHNKKIIDAKEERFSQLVENMNDWVWEVNDKGVYTFASHQVKSILGYSSNEIIGVTPFTLMDIEEAKKIRLIFSQLVVQKSKIVDLININRHKDGHEVFLLTNGAPFFNEYGDFLGYRGIDRDITQRIKKQKKIETMAYSDTLTGLANRYSSYQRIREELEYCQRNQIVSAVMFLDLDGFKVINDSLGHDNGDIVLKVISQRISSELRSFDLVGRLGGDEFIILLRGAKQCQEECYRQIELLSERIIESINEPIILQDSKLHLGVSIGIALIPQDGDIVDELIKHADSAMYKAKLAGKNCRVFYKKEFQIAADMILTLKNELIEAFEKDQFVLYYQRQCNANGSKTLGYEALIRWQHEEQGVLSPGKFLPYMEQIGFMRQLDLWVIERVCRDISSFDALTEGQITISVNLSAKSFEDRKFVSIIEEIVNRYHINTSRITLEVTEDLLITNIINVTYVIDQIKRLGFKLAIDDFGTGYSSLSYLSQINFDEIKIDMRFVQAIETSPTDRQICKLILSLAKELGVKVVAEGVETQEQLEFVNSNGADVIQGYLFSKPLSLAEVVDFSRGNLSG